MIQTNTYKWDDKQCLKPTTLIIQPSVYKHFTCKEDILCALCLDSLSSLNDYFRRASEFQGSTRSRIIYLGVGYHLYTQAFPEEFDILISARTNNIREKASPERLERMEAIDALVMSHMRGIMESALQEGDLTLPPGSTVDDLCFGMWAMSFGLLVLEHARDMVTGLNLSPAQHIHLTQMNCLLDGYRWQPLSTEHDYAATYLAAYQYLQPTVSTE